MTEWTVYIILLLVSSCHSSRLIRIYQQLSNCQAIIETTTGRQSLDLRNDPRFGIADDKLPRMRVTVEGVVHYWSPCEPFNLPPVCRDSTTTSLIGQSKANGGLCDSLGNNVTMNVVNGNLRLDYTVNNDRHEKSSVTLVCRKGEDEFKCTTPDNDCGKISIHQQEFQFSSESKAVCLVDLPMSPAPKDNDRKYFSIGSIVLITSFSVMSVYLLIGVTHGAMKGQRGWNRLPNSEFWIELPLLIKDGVGFFFRGCQPRGVRYSPIVEDRTIPIADV